MEYKFNFNTEEEKEQLIKNNSNLIPIKIAYHMDENYIVFTDEEIVCPPSEYEVLENKISILEKENELLKQELFVVQTMQNK